MTKKLALTLIAISGSALLFLNGCSKDDTAPPVVTIIGDLSEEVSLQGTWTDDLATANDEEDGALTVTSNASSSNPNLDLVGTYTITYSATDAAGNTGTAIRTVRVKNDAEDFAKNYSVVDVVPGNTYNYNQTIEVDEAINNRLHFTHSDGFAYYANNLNIYALRNAATNELSIPLQSSVSAVGTNNGGTCDVVIHWFYSTDFTSLSSSFILNYVDSVGGNTGGTSSCNGSSTTGVATYSF